MRFFRQLLVEESDKPVFVFQGKMRRHGFSMRSSEFPGLSSVAEVVGLNIPLFNASFVEAGWRLQVISGDTVRHRSCCGAIEAGFSFFHLK